MFFSLWFRAKSRAAATETCGPSSEPKIEDPPSSFFGSENRKSPLLRSSKPKIEDTPSSFFVSEDRRTPHLRSRLGVRRTPNLPTNIVDFRGFDSSTILILKGGTLRPIGDFPEVLTRAMLVGTMLVGRLGVRLVLAKPYRGSFVC